MAAKIIDGARVLKVKLTSEEKRAIVAEARRHGLTITAYIARAMEAVRSQTLVQ